MIIMNVKQLIVSLVPPHYRQFTKFSIVGTGNSIIDFTVYLLATRVFGLHFMVAKVVSWFAAVCFSFTMNKYWTFRSRSPASAFEQYIKFVIVSLVSLGLSASILYILVRRFGIYDLIANVLTIGVVVFWNFFMNKFWTFGH